MEGGTILNRILKILLRFYFARRIAKVTRRTKYTVIHDRRTLASMVLRRRPRLKNRCRKLIFINTLYHFRMRRGNLQSEHK